MFRPRIYIAGPITAGDLRHNVNQATEAFVALANAGAAPMCPHWSIYAKPAFWHWSGELLCIGTAEGNDEITYDAWLEIGLAMVEACAVLVRLPGESKGADKEVTRAHLCGIPVFFSLADAVEWCQKGGAA